MRPSNARISALEKTEGAGKAGCPMHPQPRVQRVESTRVVTTGSPGHRPSLRNGFNGFLRALPGDRALLSPSPADISTDLTPASGRQDHTTSPSALAPFVKGAITSTASHPAFVTIAKRPSDRDGICLMYCCFYPPAKQNIFRNRTGHKIAKRARRANQPTG
jgi:hypothetical protein